MPKSTSGQSIGQHVCKPRHTYSRRLAPPAIGPRAGPLCTLGACVSPLTGASFTQAHPINQPVAEVPDFTFFFSLLPLIPIPMPIEGESTLEDSWGGGDTSSSLAKTTWY